MNRQNTKLEGRPIVAGFISLLLVASCSDTSDHATTRPASISAPAIQATPDYWFKQPTVASVQSADFEKLWKSCRDVLIFDLFEVDLQDRREGVMMTTPMISKQFFEVWRSDAGDASEVARNSLQTIRRTVRIEFSRQPDGTYIAWPKVLKEQLSHPERRITAQAQFSQAFSSTYEEPNRTTDEGAIVPSRYWYAIGRDTAMEKQLARAVEERVAQKSDPPKQMTNNQ